MAGLIDLTESTFESEVAQGVVLLDFWAQWCGPCRAQHSIIEAVAQKVEGRAKVARVDVDENAAAAGKFRVDSIPTLVVLKDGNEVARYVGLTQEAVLTQAIEANL